MRISSKLLPVRTPAGGRARAPHATTRTVPAPGPRTLPPDLAARTLEALDQAVVVHDASGRLAHANPAAARLLGLGVGVARTGGELVGPDGTSPPADEHPTARCVRTGAPCGGRLLGLCDADGTRWLLVSARPLRDEAGRLTAVVTTYADVMSTAAPAGGEGRPDDAVGPA